MRNNTKILTAAVTFLVTLLALMFPGDVTAGQVNLNYSFEPPQIETVLISGIEYDRLFLPNAPNSGHEGEPALPACGASILLPLGEEVESIEVSGTQIPLGSGFNIEPVSRPVKLSADPSEYVPPSPDPVIYNMDGSFPEARFKRIGTHGFRGYQILTLKLLPVEYIPARGELFYYPELNVTVTTKSTGQISSQFRGLAIDNEDVRVKVDNPSATDSYAMNLKPGTGIYDLLILTTPDLAGAFQPLKDYHDTTGVLTEIHTTDDVGSTSPEMVRAYISDRYQNDGIQYVLIGGDDDLIPAPNLYVAAWSGGDIESEMPGDLYFGCLDGSYDGDGDGNWGEPNDGLDSGDVDLVAEVYVGRAPVGDATETERFTNKTIQYLSTNHTYMLKILMLGEHLGFGGVAEYAGTMLDQNVDTSSADGYATVGIPSDVYEVDRLYDRDWPGNDWPSSELISRIHSGLHVINHLGHGSTGSAMKLSSSTVYNSLTNTEHFFVYSQTCLAGHFDGTDCFAEYLNIKTDYSAFAVIMNARYGWGLGNSTDGPSQRFNREFWDAVFNPAEGMPELGRANQDSKEDNLYRIDEGCMRWIYYQENLFGDPTVQVKMARGMAFEYPNGVPNVTEPEQSVSFEFTVVGIAHGEPVPGTGQLHFSINDQEYQIVALTETLPNEYLVELPVLECGDHLDFYLSAEETLIGRMYDPDTESPNMIVVASETIAGFSDNCETDLGWTVSGDASDGQWGRGVPVGGGDRGDPSDDYDGSGSCYLTDNVDDNSDVDDGTTTLTSPLFEIEGDNAKVRFAIWYSNSTGGSPFIDEMHVYISNNDGGDWTVMTTLGPYQRASGGWYEYSFWVADYVVPSDQMRVRFDVSDLGEATVVEAAMDAFEITDYVCYSNLCGDVDGGGTGPDIADLVYMVDFMFNDGPPPPLMAVCNVDGLNGDDIDIADLVYLVDFMFSGGPPPICE